MFPAFKCTPPEGDVPTYDVVVAESTKLEDVRGGELFRGAESTKVKLAAKSAVSRGRIEKY